jgi:hypothetical protein
MEIPKKSLKNTSKFITTRVGPDLLQKLAITLHICSIFRPK